MENPNTIRYFLTTARNLLEYHDIEISPRKLKLRVTLPKAIVRRKEAIGKEDIREILLKCSDIKLKKHHPEHYLIQVSSVPDRVVKQLQSMLTRDYTTITALCIHI